jgi:hypothetical protein
MNFITTIAYYHGPPSGDLSFGTPQAGLMLQELRHYDGCVSDEKLASLEETKD